MAQSEEVPNPFDRSRFPTDVLTTRTAWSLDCSPQTMTFLSSNSLGRRPQRASPGVAYGSSKCASVQCLPQTEDRSAAYQHGTGRTPSSYPLGKLTAQLHTYLGDCYVVLLLLLHEQQSPNSRIFFCRLAFWACTVCICRRKTA